MSSELAETVRRPRSEADSLFQSRSLATSNDLSSRRVLDHGMTHVMAPDKRRRRLASGADLTIIQYDTQAFNVHLQTWGVARY